MSDSIKVVLLSFFAAALFCGIAALLMAFGIGPMADAPSLGAAMTPERFENEFIPLARRAILLDRLILAPLVVLIASLLYLPLVKRRHAIHGFVLAIPLSLIIEYAAVARLVMILVLGALSSLLISRAWRRQPLPQDGDVRAD